MGEVYRGDEPITLVHYTSNHLDKVNPRFAQAVRDQILSAAEGYPIITVSQEPLAFGDHNIVVGNIGRSHLNIYRQLLVGAKAALERTKTRWIAVVEDDGLYNAGHFRTHRPALHKFGYNVNRWSFFTWSKPPCFSYKERMVVNQLIAPTELLVEAMEERFAKFKDIPDSEIPISYWGDPGRLERSLKVTIRDRQPFASPEPNVILSHEAAYGYESRGKRKGLGEAPRKELYPWGSASDVLALWTDGCATTQSSPSMSPEETIRM